MPEASEVEKVVSHQWDNYRLLFDLNPLPMWVFDTHSLHFLLVNAAAVQLYGYSREEFRQMTIHDLGPRPSASQLLDTVAADLDVQDFTGDWEHQKKDGTFLQVEVVTQPLPEEQGLSRRLAVVHDVTARKLAERQLAQAEQNAQSILRNMVGMVFTFNARMEMVYISQQCQNLLGYTPEQFYSDKYFWFNLVHPQDRALFEEALPRLQVTSEPFQLEYRVTTASGEEKWLITRFGSQLDGHGRMMRLNGSANDITKRKKMEEKLRFADFSIERASEAFLWTKSDGSILRVNRSACTLLAYQKEELLALRIFDLVPGYDVSHWQSHWEALEQQKSLHFETVLQDRRGQLHPVELQLNHFFFEQESYSFLSIRQIAERKNAEAEKARLTEEMARQNEHLRQFTYIVSHNLRAPVANIVGLTHLYNRRNTADPVNVVLINKLERTTQRLDVTLKDLNEILTVRSKSELVMEPINLEQLFWALQESMGAQWSDFYKNFHVDFRAGKVVLGVKGYVHSIFLNLITNAIKYRDPNRNLEIHIKTVFSNGFLCLQIQDNGLGIDMIKQGAKVFGLYRRFHPHIEGKGLGLYMTKTQVETMGGWVDVESAVGEGATFNVYFQVPPKNDQFSESHLD